MHNARESGQFCAIFSMEDARLVLSIPIVNCRDASSHSSRNHAAVQGDLRLKGHLLVETAINHHTTLYLS